MHDGVLPSEKRDPQIAAADPLHWAFVLANAGSGKTTVLINRVARLLLRRPDGQPGAPPDTILCITYTKAAANEMLSRLFNKLGEWSLQSDEALRGVLAKLEQRNAQDYSAEQLRDARSLFARALETPGGLRIETIHAFCARVLQRFPLEANVLPGFDQIEEDEAAQLWAKARSAAILSAAETNPEALDKLALLGGHYGADLALDQLFSRRTAALALAASFGGDSARLAHALRDALNVPQTSRADFLAVQMTEALPLDVFRRAYGIMGKGSKSEVKAARTLSSFFTSADSEDKFEAYASWAFTGAGKPRAENIFTVGAGRQHPELIEYYAIEDAEGSEITRIKNIRRTLAALSAIEATEALFEVGLPALEAYEAAKRARGAVDFDDLIERTRHLLTRAGVADWVLYKLDGGLSHMLLDESQDTSPSQWDLIGALISEFGAGEGQDKPREPRTLFVVGDEKQSIYGFQGAAPDRLIDAKRKYHARVPGLRIEELLLSYRSSPEILSFVDTVWNGAPHIGAEPSTIAPPLTERGQIEHIANRADEPGRVELWPIEAPAVEHDTEGLWRKPLDVESEASPKSQLAARIATAIKAMIARGETVWDKDSPGKSRAMRYDDILILLRDRKGGLFDAIIHALKKAHLPVSGADRLILTSHIGVQDCLNLMRFAMSPARDLVLAEVLRGPFCGLVDDDRFLYPLAAERANRRETLWSRVQTSDDPQVLAVRAFLEALIARRDWPAFEFLSHALETPGVQGQTGWYRLNARLGAPVRDPVETLLQHAAAFDQSRASSLQTFVHALESRPVELKRDLESPAGEIRVMTVHGAKGLEAPVVILPDTTGKVKPETSKLLDIAPGFIWSGTNAKADPTLDAAARRRSARAEEEHRRLLYVALTRARDRLIIAGSWSGSKPKENSKTQPTGYYPGSWYALCLAAMQAIGATELDDGYYCFGGDVPCADQALFSTGPDLLLPRFEPVDAAEERRARFLAPSGLVARGAPVVFRSGSGRGAFGLRRGRLVHTLLQHLPDVDISKRASSIRTFLAAEPGLTPEQRDEIEASTLGVLNAPELAPLFEAGGRAEAAIIGTSPDLPEGVIVNGRVDRLVVTGPAVLIVDYKTDEPPPQRPEDVPETYLAQMAAYAAVLTQAYPEKRIDSVLCWTDGPRLMHLPTALLRKALAAVKTSAL